MKKPSKLKNYWKIFALALLLSLAISPVRGGYFDLFGISGYALSNIVGALLFFILTLVLLLRNRKKSKGGIVVALLLGASLELPFILLMETSLLADLNLYFKYLAILAAYSVISLKSTYSKATVIVLFLALNIFTSYFAYPYILHKYSFGTFTGEVESSEKVSITFQNEMDEDVSLESLGSEYVVLDFWYSSCGVCFRKFPLVQELYNELAGSDNIKMYSVFSRLTSKDETTATGIEILRELKYTLPVISIDYNDPILEELKVTAYPTVLIFLDGKIVFRGNIERAKDFLSDK